MNARIGVYLHANDPISRAGLETALRSQPGIALADIDGLQRNVLSPMGLHAGGLSAREADVLRLAADGADTGRRRNGARRINIGRLVVGVHGWFSLVMRIENPRPVRGFAYAYST